MQVADDLMSEHTVRIVVQGKLRRKRKMANEKRLIDANAFLKDILTNGIGKTIIEYSESDIGYMIRKRPTVDAVEVVRCKDCKYCSYNGLCNLFLSHSHEMKPDDFCSYGERKSDGICKKS